MNILMIDELSIYVHGMSVALQRILPHCQVQSADSEKQIWLILESLEITDILLDADIEGIDLYALLAAITRRYPQIPIVIMLRKLSDLSIQNYLQYNVRGVITRTASAEQVSHILYMVNNGTACFPADAISFENDSKSNNKSILLSQRQKQILQLIAAGNSNKQISRLLNISPGTVKAHLEAIFLRLHVHNRTQAANVYFSHQGSMNQPESPGDLTDVI